ncbi:MAG: cytochrome c3 family protein [Candidatus Magnetomorum sp.]|nr:cytochrome c3 family protein [Candidatus Magnetomorum sp.]
MRFKQTLLCLFSFLFLISSLSIALSSQSVPSNEPIFPHTVHEEEMSCRDCHTMYSQNKNNHFPDIEKCRECHDDMDEDGVQKNCTGDQFKEFSHLMHKRFSCQNCHNTASTPLPSFPASMDCKKCHKRQKPTWHTGFFRLRGHGIRAEMHAQKCTNCHQSTFCVRCHQSTRPLNHRGNWPSLHGRTIPGGYGGNDKCATCHKNAWCVQCHNRKIK